MKILNTILFSVFLTVSSADPYPRNEALDVEHYVFRLELNDTTNRIAGEATITIRFKKSIAAFALDLLERGPKGFGMTVEEVMTSHEALAFSQAGGKLNITLSPATTSGETRTFLVRYSGIPEDGLIIGKNKFGDRTFFGDNWPDRGHQWLPCIDHPSDKATVTFVVIAPEKYDVVATGKKQEESSLPRKQKLTRYHEAVPVAVKVMTIGVARFAVEETGEIDHIPQSTWVYPQNREAGFHDFLVGMKIFEFYSSHIGPYPYEKLAHVQSTTRWGGLENAGNIFYTESSVTGKNQHEGLIAHETAHQWFGNSVTENDWHHVWLSEGFATYFASLYSEHAYGKDRLIEEMRENRQGVIAFYSNNKRPIVDTTIVNIGEVLSTNTYAKAAWVLHMLRNKIGDEAFWKGIRNFYGTYRDKNAMTVDFIRVMEQASGMELKPFFQQWIFRPGHPQLQVQWTYDKVKAEVNITVRQLQPVPFQFPAEVVLRLPGGKTIQQTIQVAGSTEKFLIKTGSAPLDLVMDQGCKLLFEAEIKGK